MKINNTLFSSVSIFGVSLSIILDVIEPIFGGFQIAIIIVACSLMLALLVFATPPLNRYLKSNEHDELFKEIVKRYWHWPFFISNLLLLGLLIVMLQVNKAYEDTGGATRTALSALHMIESDVSELRDISAAQLEVNKDIAETNRSIAQEANFGRSIYTYASMRQYIKSGLPPGEMGAKFPVYSAEVYDNLTELLSEGFRIYDADAQIELLTYLKEKGYLERKDLVAQNLIALNSYEEFDIPDSMRTRCEVFTDNIKSLNAMENTANWAVSSIEKNQKEIAHFIRANQKYPEIAKPYIDDLRQEIRKSEALISRADGIGHITQLADSLPKYTRTIGCQWSHFNKKMSIKVDPLGLSRLRGSPKASNWLEQNTDLAGNRVTIRYFKKIDAEFVYPDWKSTNEDDVFWSIAIGEERPSTAHLNKLENELLAMDVGA